MWLLEKERETKEHFQARAQLETALGSLIMLIRERDTPYALSEEYAKRLESHIRYAEGALKKSRELA